MNTPSLWVTRALHVRLKRTAGKPFPTVFSGPERVFLRFRSVSSDVDIVTIPYVIYRGRASIVGLPELFGNHRHDGKRLRPRKNYPKLAYFSLP